MQDDLLQSLEENVGRLGPISDAIYRHESLEEVLAQVMEGIAYQQLDSKPLAFKCKCSRERLGVILSGLSEEELADICEKEGGLEITCNFCNQVYQFDQAEIDAYRSK